MNFHLVDSFFTFLICFSFACCQNIFNTVDNNFYAIYWSTFVYSIVLSIFSEEVQLKYVHYILVSLVFLFICF